MTISITKPTVGGSENTWGTTVNAALDTIVDGINGTSGTIAPDLSTLTINGTDVTATAAELNILDGLVATTAELNKLDGVTATTAELNVLDGVTATTAELNVLDGATATTAELNVLDGGTAATSTTLVDADRVVVNDNGTMVQVAMTDMVTYFESSLGTLSSVTTVGALNSGSITSGFGAIDNGSSNITTTGTISFGTLTDGTTSVTAILDEDDMTSDSATAVPTQQSVKAYVDDNGITKTSGTAPYYGARAWGKVASNVLVDGGNFASWNASTNTVTFATAMPHDDYAVVLNGPSSGNCWASSMTTTGFVVNQRSSGGNYIDPNGFEFIVIC